MAKRTFFRLFPAALIAVGAAPAASLPPVTSADTAIVQNKVAMATRYFAAVWAQIFASRGARYASPQVIAYTGSVRTGCGVQGGNNAFYCGADKRIYYDVVFLAKMMKSAAARLGTDGDYAPIVVLAHEWGHAVQDELDSASYIGLFRENMADCLAGAVTGQANADGRLDRGDIEEARYALAMAGDRPGSVLFLDPRAHGSSTTRVEEFMKGLNGGVRACRVFETSRKGSAGEPAAQMLRTFDELLQGLEKSAR